MAITSCPFDFHRRNCRLCSTEILSRGVIALLFDRRDRPMPDVALTFVVLAGGALFVGGLNSVSNVSLTSCVLTVLAPLTLSQR